jgi:hypothetical protein
MRDFPNLYFSASSIQGSNEERCEGRNIECAWWGGVLIGKCNRKKSAARPTQMEAQYDNTL